MIGWLVPPEFPVLFLKVCVLYKAASPERRRYPSGSAQVIRPCDARREGADSPSHRQRAAARNVLAVHVVPVHDACLEPQCRTGRSKEPGRLDLE